MHGGIYEKTKKLEDSKFVEPHYEIEEISKSKPYFVVPLTDPKPVNEGKNIHLECRYADTYAYAYHIIFSSIMFGIFKI